MILSGILPVMGGMGGTKRNCKRMAISPLVEQMCEKGGSIHTFVGIAYSETRYVHERWLPSMRKGAAVFSDNLLRFIDNETGNNYLN